MAKAPLQSSIHNGMTLPLFKRKGRPSPVSASDANLLVRILQAFVNIEIVTGTSPQALLTDRKLLLVVGGGTGSTDAGMHYRGTYDNRLAYSTGDVVRVRSGDNFGTWVNVIAQAALGSPPVLPEPLDAGTGVNNWELLGGAGDSCPFG